MLPSQVFTFHKNIHTSQQGFFSLSIAVYSIYLFLLCILCSSSDCVIDLHSKGELGVVDLTLKRGEGYLPPIGVELVVVVDLTLE